jgi:NUDIX domain-containing protein
MGPIHRDAGSAADWGPWPVSARRHGPTLARAMDINDGVTELHRSAVRLVLVDASGRVLLLHVIEPQHLEQGDCWELPGGGIDSGETVLAAAQCELLPRDRTTCPGHGDQVSTLVQNRRVPACRDQTYSGRSHRTGHDPRGESGGRRRRGPSNGGRRVLIALAPALKTVPAGQPPGLHLALAFHADEPHRLGDEVVTQELPGRTADLDLV